MSAIQADRDAAWAALSIIQAEWDAAKTEKNTTRAERDALLQDRADWDPDRVTLQAEIDRLRTERAPEQSIVSMPPPSTSESQSSLAWMPRQQLETELGRAREEVQRLTGQERELLIQLGMWRGRAERSEAWVDQRLSSSHSRSTSRYSHSVSKRSRVDEGSRRTEGGVERGPPEGGGES